MALSVGQVQSKWEKEEGAPPSLIPPPSQAGPQQPGLLPPRGRGAAPPPLPAALIRAELASCIINSTASLPVFTLITCWEGGWEGGSKVAKPGASRALPPSAEQLCQPPPRVWEVGFETFPHLSPLEGPRASEGNSRARLALWERPSLTPCLGYQGLQSAWHPGGAQG